MLDASAFYAGIPFASQEASCTTPEVFEEIKHIKKNHDAVNALLETKRLDIINPQAEFREQVILKARETGDFQNLSKGDISVVALCLQMHAEIVTDDFAVSNVAKHLGLNVIPVMTQGIARVVDWLYFCPGCKKTFSKIFHCPFCGNQLRRKLGKRRSSANFVSK